MIPCPKTWCDGVLHISGFIKRTANQKCPIYGRFRKVIGSEPPQLYCKKCASLQNIEVTVQQYACNLCMAFYPEDQPDINRKI